MNLPTTLYVLKRDGTQQPVEFDKISRRLTALCADPLLARLRIDATVVSQKVCSMIYAGVSTAELDELASQICSSMQTINPEYGQLASRIVVSNHHKNTPDSFARYLEIMRNGSDLIQPDFFEFSEAHADAIQAALQYRRDFDFDYFGFKTLEKSYLLKAAGSVVERPQHMWMRVAIGLHRPDITACLKCYEELATKCYTHATPTLFNSGTRKNQLASCFLLPIKDDSIEGIFDTIKSCAMISKHAGGIGLSAHCIRSTGSSIHGTNGKSNGIVPMLRVFNDTARYVDQGGGKRNGSFAVYLEPWHADVVDFLHMKRNHGDEASRARDLFYALWTPDLFMRRVQADEEWTLFDPSKVPRLAKVYGDEFDRLYAEYEAQGLGQTTMPAKQLWSIVLDSMVETGTPYVLFKDACNKKSNQQNLGTIQSSNLCTEIVEYSSKEETAVCNLASLSLPAALRPARLHCAKATVHTRPGCVFCNIALAHLRRLGYDTDETLEVVRYEDTDDDTAKYKAAFPDRSTFPTILFDDEVVGGFTELVDRTRPTFDFSVLERLTRSLVRNLNQTIDKTYYPTPETRCSNLRRRPIGIGVQGLADVLMQMRYTFDGEEARNLNKQIFASIYYAAVSESVQLSKERAASVRELEQLLDDNIEHPHIARHFNQLVYGNPPADHSASPVLASCTVDPALTEQLNSLMQKIGPLHTDILPRDRRLFGDAYAGAYEGFETSPIAKGQFQFDLWDEYGGDPRYDWDALRADIKAHGVRNSLLVAPMPTASTAQILGNTECFEPITSNIYLRRTLAGEFIMVNRYMHQDLIDMGLWTTELKDELLFREGSLREIKGIPQYFKGIYKTVWDMSQRTVLDMAADRGRYICQSQSMNLFLADAPPQKISSMLFYAWNKGLKTGIYYLRTKPSAKAQQFTIDPAKYHAKREAVEEDEPCLSCSA
jgi:ribonucleoside-diphosphate reductase alpha subunit